MASILVAGASGKVGHEVLQALKQHHVRVLVRNQVRRDVVAKNTKEIFTADARDVVALQGACQNIDVVISSIGASLQMRRTQSQSGYWDVDYQANRNLLAEAKRAGVRKFIYVSVFKAQEIKGSAYFEAHAAFEDELKRSGLDYAIIRPTGIFYIFEEFVNFARRGIIPLFGDGSAKTNPIDERDVAQACVAAIESTQKEFDVGGPDVFSRREIGALCFQVWGKKPRFIPYPVGLMRILIKPLKLFDQRLFDLLDFAILVSNEDVVAPRAGTNKLENYLNHLTASG